jgi:murein DD-endopeptidase MepM/ murein hydrolase activator NlpD
LEKEKGFSMMQGAGLGYVLVQMTPLVLKYLSRGDEVAMIVRITSKFGSVDAVHKTPHTGVDLAMQEGTPLRALGEGVVDRIYDGTANIGKGLSIKFDDGTRLIYGHMSDVKARIGEHVHAGEIIGLSGNTGHSTGPHLAPRNESA